MKIRNVLNRTAKGVRYERMSILVPKRLEYKTGDKYVLTKPLLGRYYASLDHS